jgi:hypothetical protein
MMDSALQREIARAVRAGFNLDEIEELVIDPAPLDEDQKAALWLYAEVLEWRRGESMLIQSERPSVNA